MGGNGRETMRKESRGGSVGKKWKGKKEEGKKRWKCKGNKWKKDEEGK